MLTAPTQYTGFPIGLLKVGCQLRFKRGTLAGRTARVVEAHDRIDGYDGAVLLVIVNDMPECTTIVVEHEPVECYQTFCIADDGIVCQ